MTASSIGFGFVPFSLAKPQHEGMREQRDVLDALAEVRAAEREHVEAEEEVLAEAAVVDALREVLVRGGEDAHVDVDDVLAAYARDLARLQRAEDLGLRDEVHVADLVEEERAAVRPARRSHAASTCAPVNAPFS